MHITDIKINQLLLYHEDNLTGTAVCCWQKN